MSERLSIGDFARATGLTTKALRLYDDLGLLAPAFVDPVNGYRWYAADQVEQARLVATLRLIGMPLTRIAAVVTEPDGAADEVAAYWRQVEADTASRRELVRTLVQRLREENTMDTEPNSLAAQAGLSHRQGARSSQQDAVLAEGDLYAVADGFGEHDDLASRALVALSSTGIEAAAAVAREGGTAAGTTLTAVRIEGGAAVLTHVGDGRVQLLRDRRLSPLTRDHTLVADLIAKGELTEEEARSHPHRMLLNRALGTSEPDVVRVPLRAGDRLVLTTDGVHSVLSSGDLEALVLGVSDPQEAADAVAGAVEAAGAPDNHSIVVVDVE